MNDEINRGRFGWAVTASAVLLGVLGMALLISGQWVGVSVFGRNDVEPVASLLGAALVGFGAMNWIARRSTLGGIYGRSLVAGNLAHFLVGSLVLLKHGAAVGGSGLFWILGAFYVLGAALFSYLLFGTGVRRP